MTAQAPAIGTTAKPTVRPAAAAQGLRTVIDGIRTPWDLLGVSSTGLWCGRDERVVVLTSVHGAKLPNAVLMGGREHGWIDRAGDIWIGQGLVETSSDAWKVTRWWGTTPCPAPIDPGKVADLIALGGWPADARVERFVTGVVLADADLAVNAALSLLGDGSGLTPEGDDVLLGAIALCHFVGSSLPGGGLASALAASREPVLGVARQRTTRLSWVLLDHAYRGEVASPLGRLLVALTGRGDVPASFRLLQQIGASSGEAWARGAARAAVRLCGVFR